jgi:hypothetical protein
LAGGRLLWINLHLSFLFAVLFDIDLTLYSESTIRPSRGFKSLALEQDNTGTLALTAQAPGQQAWGRWAEQHPAQAIDTFFAMDISGIIQSYDSRATSSAALTQTVMAPQYHNQPYTGTASNTLAASHEQIQHNPFSFNAYSAGTPNGLIPAFANNYIRQRPLPHLMHQGTEGSRGVSYTRNDHRGFVEEPQRQSPPIKTEQQITQWSPPISSLTFASDKTKTITSPLPNGTTDINFGTEVDTLMKAIQAKSQTVPPQTSSPVAQSRPVVGPSFTPPYVQTASQGGIQIGEESKFKLTGEDIQDEASSPKGGKKRYQCTIEHCTKSFYQKTHLDIHVRAHTGDKPYVSILYSTCKVLLY